MYRPDRIGPNPFATLDSPSFDKFGLNTATFGTTIEWQSSIGAPNESFKAQSVHFSQIISLPSDEGGAYGVKVLGTSLFDGDEYLLSVAGSMVGFSNDEGVTIKPIIGRTELNGGAGGTLSQWAFVPELTSGHGRTSGTEVSAVFSSCNHTMVIGDFEPSGDPLENDIFFGFWFANGGSGPAEVTKAHGSFSIHRYISDLKPFDPNR